MITGALAIFNDQEYARSNEYLKKLGDLEFEMEYLNGEKREASKEEYVALVLRYGGRTKQSWELAEKLVALKKSDIVDHEALNLKDGTLQLHEFNIPCKEGGNRAGVYNANDIQKILRIGRNKAYELMKSNQFPVIVVGGRRFVSKMIFNDWLNRD